VLTERGVQCAKGEPVHCTFSEEAPPIGFVQVSARIDAPGEQSSTARIVSTTPESNTANNTSELSNSVRVEWRGAGTTGSAGCSALRDA
jgi:hypothetical protein